MKLKDELMTNEIELDFSRFWKFDRSIMSKTELISVDEWAGICGELGYENYKREELKWRLSG